MCLLSLVQTFLIPHKAHICTAGIVHRRSGTKDLNDLTENREKGYNFNIYCTQTSTIIKLVPPTGDCNNQFLICYDIHLKNYAHLIG